MAHPLVEEAVKKAAIAWISVAGGPAYGLWCMPADGALHIVVGPGEQTVPGMIEAATALVILRGDHGGAIVEYEAEVHRVLPGTDQWEAIVPSLAGKRLNAPGPTEELVARWARECAVLALTPAGDPLPLRDSSGIAPPRPTPAANPTPKPFRLHRVRRRPTK